MRGALIALGLLLSSQAFVLVVFPENYATRAEQSLSTDGHYVAPSLDVYIWRLLNPLQTKGAVACKDNPTKSIDSKFVDCGMTTTEKRQLKSQAIVSSSPVGQYTSHGVKVEITAVEEIEGGVQVFARAWKGTEQLGFGADGSVDVERFRIFNPPVLVEDPNGTIIRENIVDGVAHTRKLREDPAEAIRQTIAHDITIVGKTGTVIIPNKVGNTTDTYFPDPSVTVTSVDGRNGRQSAGGESWATIRAGAGGNADDTGAQDFFVRITNTAGGTVWRFIGNSYFFFDTSALPDTDTISSATMSLFITSHPGTQSLSAAIVDGVLASNTAIVNGDFVNRGSTRQSASDWAEDSLTDAAYNDFALNATGIGNVSKTSISKFGLRATNDLDNVEPTKPAGQENLIDIIGYYADQTGTTNDPKLVVVHAAAAAATSVTQRVFMIDSE